MRHSHGKGYFIYCQDSLHDGAGAAQGSAGRAWQFEDGLGSSGFDWVHSNKLIMRRRHGICRMELIRTIGRDHSSKSDATIQVVRSIDSELLAASGTEQDQYDFPTLSAIVPGRELLLTKFN
jgi:hypothetical protein